MNRFLVIVCLLALVFASGCHVGDFAKVTATSIGLNGNNYVVVMTDVTGTDAGFKVLGLGPTAQFSKCLAQIRTQAQLKDRPRALINVTQDYTWYQAFIVSGDDLTITCDVIEFTGTGN